MEQLSLFFNIFVGFFTIINPIAAIPTWIILTSDYSKEERSNILRKVIINVFVMLLITVLLGKLILLFFGIELIALKLAGSLMIIITAINMGNTSKKLPKKIMDNAEKKEDLSFTPITLPLLIGPGTIAVAIGYADEFGYIWDWNEPMGYLLIILTILIICFIIYLSFKFSTKLKNLIGLGGILTIGRIMSFILLSVGFQILYRTIVDIVNSFIQ